MQMNPAKEVTRFKNNILTRRTDDLLIKISLLVRGRVRRYSAVLLYSSFSRMFDASTIA